VLDGRGITAMPYCNSTGNTAAELCDYSAATITCKRDDGSLIDVDEKDVTVELVVCDTHQRQQGAPSLAGNGTCACDASGAGNGGERSGRGERLTAACVLPLVACASGTTGGLHPASPSTCARLSRVNVGTFNVHYAVFNDTDSDRIKEMPVRVALHA
jgi:hypothetical protein